MQYAKRASAAWFRETAISGGCWKRRCPLVLANSCGAGAAAQEHEMVCGVAYVVPVGQAVGVGEVQARLIIEPPRWGLVAMVAWIGFLCLVMVLGAVDEHDPRGLFLVLVWLPWLVPVALLARIRLSAAGDVLTYRGPFRTRLWRRDEIDCFGIVQSSVSAKRRTDPNANSERPMGRFPHRERQAAPGSAFATLARRARGLARTYRPLGSELTGLSVRPENDGSHRGRSGCCAARFCSVQDRWRDGSRRRRRRCERDHQVVESQCRGAVRA